ncbi:hypothetical protein [Paenibacillus woosongensis]|uniref:Uncharacterized protein n=1 Tax=Paenibacillus woosongensis TaxID=307580 RepID=A0ABQ4MRQ5_9BACL|nr:hypothetical protein [Paenibacillus woosongensis]GIP58678.1 hypothetical protein J15TS10_24920 [Paenibacillus woosongensis]
MKTIPKLRAVIVVEDTNFIPTQSESKLVLVQPILSFNVPFIPTQLSFNLVTAVSHFDKNQNYRIDLKVINSKNGQELTFTSWEIQDIDDKRNSPASGLMITSIKNMIVEDEGDYIIEVYAEGEKIGEDFFGVYKS